jgi:hypothetical protein
MLVVGTNRGTSGARAHGADVVRMQLGMDLTNVAANAPKGL